MFSFLKSKKKVKVLINFCSKFFFFLNLNIESNPLRYAEMTYIRKILNVKTIILADY